TDDRALVSKICPVLAQNIRSLLRWFWADAAGRASEPGDDLELPMRRIPYHNTTSHSVSVAKNHSAPAKHLPVKQAIAPILTIEETGRGPARTPGSATRLLAGSRV